jgi:integrase
VLRARSHQLEGVRFGKPVGAGHQGMVTYLAPNIRLPERQVPGRQGRHVDLNQGTLQVSRIRSGAKGSASFTTPKNNKSRSIRLTTGAVQALHDHRKRHVEERLKHAGNWQDTDLVFTSTVGTPLNRHNVFGRSFNPLLSKAGLPHTVRFHDRHTCATLLCSKNINPKIVQEMLGHANLSQTMDIYSHVLPNMQNQAASVMESALT